MDNLQRLGQLVKAERRRLYRTVDKARAVAQLSRGAWDNVEHGRPAKDLTYVGVEEALHWAPGSCNRVLDGGDPVPLDTPAERTYVVRAGSPSDSLAAEVRASNLSESSKRWLIEHLLTTSDTPNSETG